MKGEITRAEHYWIAEGMGVLRCDSTALAADSCKNKFICKHPYVSTYAKEFCFAANLENKVHKIDLHESFLICIWSIP